jgi:uncharacterized protein (TIRG00374 family)
MFASFMVLRNRTFMGWIINQLERFRLLRGFSEHLRTFYEEGRALLAPWIFIQSMILSLVAWFFEGLGFAVVAWGFHSGISLTEGVFIYSAALLGGALTLFLGGLGATEGSMVGLGIALGMSRPVSGATTIIIRVMTLWFAVLIGWLVFLTTPWLRSLLKAAREDEEELTSEELPVEGQRRL